jgi:hypothetical protein
MVNRAIGLIILVMILFQNGCSWGWGLPEAKITIKVIDEQGKYIEGAHVGIGFERNTGGGTKEIPVDGITDIDGLFSGQERSNNYVGYTVTKEGYYQSTGTYRFKDNNGRWEPWNPEVKIILRKIGNPIPMYAREVMLEIPKIDKEIGFDLIESDWVSPFGKGIKSDFTFKLYKVFVSKKEFDSKLNISYANKYDGIIKFKEEFIYGSQFKLPRNAPESGYQPSIVKYHKLSPGKITETDYDKNTGYIFKIRSEIRNGKFYRAMYGKIQGDISYDPMNSKTAYIVFKYYLNPDYSTNLEFDPKRNLFYDLHDSERVGL